ncbi:hypothetical protein Tco_1218323 [Tanacetum coccineum]
MYTINEGSDCTENWLFIKQSINVNVNLASAKGCLSFTELISASSACVKLPGSLLETCLSDSVSLLSQMHLSLSLRIKNSRDSIEIQCGNEMKHLKERHASGHVFRPGPVWGCDRLVSRAKVIENQVMAILVISVSSDSSEDSVGTPAGRVSRNKFISMINPVCIGPYWINRMFRGVPIDPATALDLTGRISHGSTSIHWVQALEVPFTNKHIKTIINYYLSGGRSIIPT